MLGRADHTNGNMMSNESSAREGGEKNERKSNRVPTAFIKAANESFVSSLARCRGLPRAMAEIRDDQSLPASPRQSSLEPVHML